MNKKLEKVLTLTLSVFIITILLTTCKANAETILDTTAATVINNAITPLNTNQNDIRERIRADIQNAQVNQNVRAQILEKNRIASTSPKINTPFRVENKKIENRIEQKIENEIEERQENRLEKRLSSTTIPIRREAKDGYEDNGRSMVSKVLKERKEVLAKQLNIAMQNLIELRKRISSRVEKDRLANKDLSTVSELIKIADDKIAIAKKAVETVRSYNPQNPNTSTTTPINLDEIRKIVDNAQKSIKEAHRALTDVVVAIAKVSGINKDKNASSTPQITIPVPSPTTNQ